jgi:MFS family permease
VAWLAELFPNPRQRENVLGYTQAFSSIGGLLVAIASGLAVSMTASGSLPVVAIPSFLTGLLGSIDPEFNQAWRYTLMSGLIPAIPLIVIRPFLPESPAWAAKREAGTLRRPSFSELFSPGLITTTIVTTIMFACSYGAAFGAIQQIPQIVPGLPETKAKVAAEVEKLELPKDEVAAKKMKIRKTREIEQKLASEVTKVQEIGGLIGRFLLALLAVQIVSRRALLRVFQIPGLIIMPIVFAYCAVTSLNLLYAGIFVAGLLTVAQFSFWGNYLPRVYPVHLRGTGESFAANVGGRMIGTSFAGLASWLATVPQPDTAGIAPRKMAYVAAGIAFAVYLVGTIACFWLPEPKEGQFGDE